MMYFDGVFQQHYLSTNPLNMATSGTPNALTAGQLGLFLTNQYGEISSAISSGTTQNVTLAMGSWHTVGTVSPNYMGLKVPQYSKAIQWNSVSLFQYIKGHALQQQIVSVGWDQTYSGATSSVGPVFYCQTDYTLKLEILGDAALAALNKNIYNNLQAWGGCCGSNCTSGCTSTAVDAAYIMLQWKDAINQNPLLSPFVTPNVFISSGGTKVQVYDAYDKSLNAALTVYTPNTSNPSSVIASLQLTVSYTPTDLYGSQGQGIFSTNDRYEYSPLWINASLVTQTPDACAVNTTINTSVPNMVTQLQAPLGAVGLGQAVLDKYIISQSYRQQFFHDSLTSVDQIRMRFIENYTAVTDFNLTGIYDQVVLVHSITRRSNPTALHSNDRYMIIVDIPSGTNVTVLTNLITNSLALVGSSVTLDTIN